MIVKNEESRIRRAIAGVREYVKEIVVVDTGSTDRTRDVSREAGATVLDFPFDADFSAARNFSLTACTGEWILVLDADEFFPLSPRFMLDTAIAAEIAGEANPYKGYYLLRHNYEDNEWKVTYSDYVLRLFRNLKGVRYQHRVHESPEDSLDPMAGKYGKLTSMPLSHYLFERDEAYLTSKHIAYVDGLLKDISENPANASRYDFLGCEYVRMGRFEDAEQAFLKLLRLDPDNAGGRESLTTVRRLMGRHLDAA